jgi:surface protein
MDRMFFGCSSFNQSVSNFNTADVTNMYRMFLNCSSFNQSVSNFNIAKVTNMDYMLQGCDINAAGTTTNYDATLVAWAAQDAPNSLNFHGGTSKYGEGLVDNGTTDGAAANKLIQSGQNFITTVTIGDVVYNTTDGTYAFVTGIDSDTQLSISADIMASGEVYRIQHGAGAKARASLIIDDLWTITDGGAL